MYRGNTKSTTCAENFQRIIEDDPLNPFDVDSLYPCVVVPSYTCPTCNTTTKTPICVKRHGGTSFYCPTCHTNIKNSNKAYTRSL